MKNISFDEVQAGFLAGDEGIRRGDVVEVRPHPDAALPRSKLPVGRNKLERDRALRILLRHTSPVQHTSRTVSMEEEA